MTPRETEFEKISRWIRSLEEEKVLDRVKEFVRQEPAQEELILMLKALNKGITGVVDRYEKGQYFVGDIIYAMEMLAEVESLLTPLAGKDEAEKIVRTLEKEENLVEELLTIQWRPALET